MVSICMITYNHANYIRQAIEGVMMQRTSFDIELIIGDDCSTDSTRDICLRFQKTYPGKIRLNEKINNIGPIKNFIKTLGACTGKYVAICEGDDYWVDPLKLQKQVDFLESNNDYSSLFS